MIFFSFHAYFERVFAELQLFPFREGASAPSTAAVVLSKHHHDDHIVPWHLFASAALLNVPMLEIIISQSWGNYRDVWALLIWRELLQGITVPLCSTAAFVSCLCPPCLFLGAQFLLSNMESILPDILCHRKSLLHSYISNVPFLYLLCP